MAGDFIYFSMKEENRTFQVWLYYHGCINGTVSASDGKEALEKVREQTSALDCADFCGQAEFFEEGHDVEEMTADESPVPQDPAESVRNRISTLYERLRGIQGELEGLMLQEMVTAVPDGKELIINSGLSPMDCNTPFYVTDNACRAPYPEMSVHYPWSVRNRDGVLEYGVLNGGALPYDGDLKEIRSNSRYCKVDDHYVYRFKSIESLHGRIGEIRDGVAMDFQPYDLHDIVR